MCCFTSSLPVHEQDTNLQPYRDFCRLYLSKASHRQAPSEPLPDPALLPVLRCLMTMPPLLLQARVTDFGLARRMQSRGDDFSVLAPEATVVMGTFGYVAPEYARTGESRDYGASLKMYVETKCVWARCNRPWWRGLMIVLARPTFQIAESAVECIYPERRRDAEETQQCGCMRGSCTHKTKPGCCPLLLAQAR